MLIIAKNPEVYLEQRSIKPEVHSVDHTKNCCDTSNLKIEKFALQGGMLMSSDNYIKGDKTLKTDQVTIEENKSNKRSLTYKRTEGQLVNCFMHFLKNNPPINFQVTNDAWQDILTAYRNAGYAIEMA